MGCSGTTSQGDFFVYLWITLAYLELFPVLQRLFLCKRGCESISTVTPVQEALQPEHSQGDNHGYNYGNKTGCIHVSSPSSLPRSKSGRSIQLIAVTGSHRLQAVEYSRFVGDNRLQSNHG